MNVSSDWTSKETDAYIAGVEAGKRSTGKVTGPRHYDSEQARAYMEGWRVGNRIFNRPDPRRYKQLLFFSERTVDEETERLTRAFEELRANTIKELKKIPEYR